jgi:hypothetical protein
MFSSRIISVGTGAARLTQASLEFLLQVLMENHQWPSYLERRRPLTLGLQKTTASSSEIENSIESPYSDPHLLLLFTRELDGNIVEYALTVERRMQTDSRGMWKSESI